MPRLNDDANTRRNMWRHHRARRQASMSHRLSRYVICANARVRNCSVQRRLRTRTSPPYITTMRSKLVHGTKSMTCANSIRPAFTAMSPIGKIEEITAKPSSQVRIDTKQYPTVFHILARSASGAGARKAHLRQYPFAIAAGPERTASACFRRP
jgi:hypothetical protein